MILTSIHFVIYQAMSRVECIKVLFLPTFLLSDRNYIMRCDELSPTYTRKSVGDDKDTAA